MTNDDLENSMRFIVEHQAHFAASQQQINERVVRLETNMAEMALGQSLINEVVIVMARAQTHLDTVVAAMVETHRHTEERLDAFIGVLERYISKDRNGSSNGESAS